MRGHKTIASLLLGTLLLCGCERQENVARAGAGTGTSVQTPRDALPSPHELSHATAVLAAKVYPQLAIAAGANANLFISPVSLSQGLGLAYIGARGGTREEIGQVLGWTSSRTTVLTKGYNAQLTETGDPDVALGVANALWLSNRVSIRPEYVAEADDAFAASPQTVDYARDPIGSARRINDWVSHTTNGRIAQIVSASDFDADTAAVLTSALHFKAKWQVQFASTETRTFTRGDGSSGPITMMKRIGRFQYRRSSQGQAIALPYGHNGRFVMEIFLPRDAATLRRWEREMKSADFFAGEQGGNDRFALAAQTEREVRLVLPRFQARFRDSMNAALIAAGMPSAFDRRRADLSGIASAPLAIDEVGHATFLRVDEEGTEAAAATAVQIQVVSVPAPFEGLEMVVDRPFLAALRDRRSGALLFFGRIADLASD